MLATDFQKEKEGKEDWPFALGNTSQLVSSNAKLGIALIALIKLFKGYKHW